MPAPAMAADMEWELVQVREALDPDPTPPAARPEGARSQGGRGPGGPALLGGRPQRFNTTYS